MADLSPLQEADPLRGQVVHAAALLSGAGKVAGPTQAANYEAAATALLDALSRRTAWLADLDAEHRIYLATKDREIAELRKANEKMDRVLHESDATPWPQAAQERVALQDNVAALGLLVAEQNAEIAELRKALVEAAACGVCEGTCYVGEGEVCEACAGAGVGTGLSDATQTAAAKAKEAIDG